MTEINSLFYHFIYQKCLGGKFQIFSHHKNSFSMTIIINGQDEYNVFTRD